MKDHTSNGRSKQRSARRNTTTPNHRFSRLAPRAVCLQIPFMVGDCPLCHALRLQAPGLLGTDHPIADILCVFHKEQATNSD